MERSKKILFGVIAFIVLSLIIVLCLYSYNIIDTANAVDYAVDDYISTAFPYSEQNPVVNFNFGWEAVNLTNTNSTYVIHFGNFWANIMSGVGITAYADSRPYYLYGDYSIN